VNDNSEHSEKKRAGQAVGVVSPEALKIGASTPYDFTARNLTAYGGLLPVATMLEKLGFQQLVEDTLTMGRLRRAMPPFQFVLAMVLGLYIGFARLNHLRFLEREPMLTGILKIVRLPPQSTFWRFLASLPLSVAAQILKIQRLLRQRVWEAAHVQLNVVTLDTDTTVHTLFGHQLGGRRSYNPKNKGKKSFQPILTFLAETREYVAGELRNGDRPTGAQIARHLASVFAALPREAETIYARADSGFYCAEAVEAYERAAVQFIHLRTEDVALDRGTEGGGLETLSADRRRWLLRVTLSTGGLEQSLPVHRLALREEAEATAGGRTRAIPVVRHAGVQLPRVRHQYEGRGRPADLVLQSAGGRGESDQRSQ
jgi:hypothetical protein